MITWSNTYLSLILWQFPISRQLKQVKWNFFYFLAAKNGFNSIRASVNRGQYRYLHRRLLSLSEWTAHFWPTAPLGMQLIAPLPAGIGVWIFRSTGHQLPVHFCVSARSPVNGWRDEKRFSGEHAGLLNFPSTHYVTCIDTFGIYREWETIDPPPVYHSERESCSRGFISSRLALNQQLYVRDSRAHFIPRWWPIDRFLSISWLADCTHHVADYGCVSSFIHHRAGRRREIFIYYMGTSLYSRDFGRAESIADWQNRDERICQRLIGMFQWRCLELFSGAAFQKYRNFLL